MAVDARMSTITSTETYNQIKDLAERYNLSTSKTINNLVELSLSLQAPILWEMAAAKTVLGYDIIAEINALIDEKKNRA